ncbi:MAG: glycosyltransferase family 4 protein [Chroococcus sp. CMT-3BRIN-NPC107]|nr:glycosyltransferase family 4 protein [Chroococcus sp. CMT-3BRIN-NPC107]
MKLLSISSELPPFNYGGYEVGAWRVSHALRDLHDVDVHLLTSMRGVETGLHLGEKNCYRLLPRPGCWIAGDRYIAHGDLKIARKQRKLALLTMQEIVDYIKPDAVLFWQVFGFSKACSGSLYSLDIFNYLKTKQIPAYLYSSVLELPILQLVSPQYLLETQQIKKLYQWIRYQLVLLRQRQSIETIALDWSKVAFCSEWLKENHLEFGYPAELAQVIHWGIEVKPSYQINSQTKLPLKILWAGRICPAKGLHIVVEALKQLPRESYILDVYGHEEDKSYVKNLRTEIEKEHLETTVSFQGFIQSETLRQKLAEYDIFILSSIWQEPFSVGLLEAAAAGLVLISTLTGGTSEILSEQNALIYHPENADELASCLQHLAENLNQVNRYKELAYHTAEQYSLQGMVDKLYKWLFK